MTDVVRLALDRRAELYEEMARIEDFIRMADNLMQKMQPRPRPRAVETSGERPRHGAEAVAEEDPHPAAPAAPGPAAQDSREQPPQEPRAPAPREAAGPGVTRMNLIRRGAVAMNG
jgi:hypothetical protein